MNDLVFRSVRPRSAWSRSFLRALWPVLLLVGLGLVAQAAATRDETTKNFKKYFGTYKDVPSRVEAVLSLEGVDDKEVVELLVPILKDPESEIVRAAVRILAKLPSPGTIEALFAAYKTEKSELVRVGILRATGEGKYDGTLALAQSALTDKSWEVRRHALQVIESTKDAAAAAACQPLLDDPEPAVRGQALETLTVLGSEAVVAKACALLSDPIWQVRASAIQALTKIRHASALQPLVDRLQVEEGVLAPQIVEALANLTGLELVEPAAWKNWWEANKATFVLPKAEAIAYMRGKREATTGKAKWDYAKSGVADYHGINTPSRSVLFVIDVSGSMEAEVVEKERFSDGNYPSYQRIDIVKTELQRTIDRLAPYVNFNVVAFATKIDPWKKGKLVPANVLNKSAAKDWAKGLVAIGGSSKEDLASAGLIGAANLDMGKTNTFGAIMTAMGIDPTKGPQTGDKDYKTEVDTIFFLSDGRPTVGEFVDPDDILREVKAANELRKITIHTIAIGEFQKDFMRKMAEENGGQFVDLGK
ncbi:MAG: HEAT repeat domain-containing protein [Planctomycetota bacterium]|nr:HEAT repeat domain-containing protein [Planctomycetota bacterium]